MLVEQVHVIGLQAIERSVHRGLDVLGPTVEPADLPGIFDVETEFGRNHHALAPIMKRSAQQALILEGTVNFRGIEKVHAGVERGMERGRRFRIITGSIHPAHTHTPEAERGNLESLAA